MYLRSQYLHPLKLLAYSLRGASTEFHSSAGPSQRNRFINAVVNLKMGPDWFHLDLSAVQTTTFRCPDAFFQIQKHRLMSPWVNNDLIFSAYWTSTDADVCLCDVCRDSVELFCVHVSCQDLSAHCWFRSGREKTRRAEEPNASIFRVCANQVVICSRQKIMAHFSFQNIFKRNTNKREKDGFPGSSVEDVAKFLYHQDCPGGNSALDLTTTVLFPEILLNGQENLYKWMK